MGLIFRNDDVNPNTDMEGMDAQYDVIRDLFPDVEIWSAITMFSRMSDRGAVYNQVPFKDRPLEWFYDVNRLLYSYDGEGWEVICSHGLLHVDHSQLSRDAQEMSILTSCNYLQTDIFVPPFNRYNETTEEICDNHCIDLIEKEGWKNFEYEDFDPSHEQWYFHSWRWNKDTLREKLLGKRRNVGQL